MDLQNPHSPGTLRAIVAASLLDLGFRTNGPRAVREKFLDCACETWPVKTVELLWDDPGERRWRLAEAFTRADAALAETDRLGYGVLTCLDPEYPELLGQIIDPPIVLWTRGDVSCLAAPGVAVVGSRKALDASVVLARDFGRGLAEAGLVVTSGFAQGVDTSAHLGALDGGGSTIAVLGCGLDVRYPWSNVRLKERIADGRGVVVTEFPPGTPPFGQHFPIRNRIIAGLSRSTVVVEAGLDSGSLHTANSALEQGREVLAVPGPVMAEQHAGCHALIKDGAPLVETVEDILKAIRWSPPPESVAAKSRKHLQLSNLEATMAKGEPFTVDDLSRRTGQSASIVMAELSQLELNGRVKRTLTGAFIRTVGPGRARKPGGRMKGETWRRPS
jgi:DNA processing protein